VRELLSDLWAYLRVRKRFWLLPLVVIMVLLAVLSLVTQSTAVGPFIYTVF
jgi:hypothetical protein